MIVLWLLLSLLLDIFFMIIIDRAPIFTVNCSLFNLFFKNEIKKNYRNYIAIVSVDLESTATKKGIRKKRHRNISKYLKYFWLVEFVEFKFCLSVFLFSINCGKRSRTKKKKKQIGQHVHVFIIMRHTSMHMKMCVRKMPNEREWKKKHKRLLFTKYIFIIIVGKWGVKFSSDLLLTL